MINQISAKSCTLLNDFYAQVCDWIACQKAHDLMCKYFLSNDRSWEEIERYREKRGDAKYLADEIMPVLDHLNFLKFEGDVKFQMDSNIPDAWIRHQDELPIGIEVTVAASRSQVVSGCTLNKKGRSFGSPRLPDSASAKDFELWGNSEGLSELIADTKHFMRNQILESLNRKNHEKYRDMHLLIQFESSFPINQWEFLIDDLKNACESAPFSEVHLIAKVRAGEPFGLQIK